MAKRYRALVIGCGRIGSRFDESGSPVISTHAGAYANEPRIELAGLCDHDFTRAKEAAAFWKIDRVFDDPISALEATQPDLVSICTPDATHGEMLRLVMGSKCVRAILAEKPLALASQEASALAAHARGRALTLIVNYSRRFHGAYRRAREDLANGRIGEIRAVTGYYSRGIKHNGTHWIDLARWCIGEIAAVRADPAVVEVEEDPTPDVRFEFQSGAVGLLKGVDQRSFALFEMDILGSSGRLRITQGPRFGWSRSRPNPSHPEFRYLHEDPAASPAPESSVAAAVANALECIEGRSSPWCSADDGIRALEVAEACLQSLQSGRTERPMYKGLG